MSFINLQAQAEYGIILLEKKDTADVAERAAGFLELAVRQKVHLFHSEEYIIQQFNWFLRKTVIRSVVLLKCDHLWNVILFRSNH